MTDQNRTGSDVARDLDASLRSTSLTDSGNAQFRQMQTQLNQILGTNLEVDGYATLRANRGVEAENITRLSNTQQAIAEFIDQYAPELAGRTDLTVDNLLGAIEEAAELKQQGLLQRAQDRAAYEAAAAPTILSAAATPVEEITITDTGAPLEGDALIAEDIVIEPPPPIETLVREVDLTVPPIEEISADIPVVPDIALEVPNVNIATFAEEIKPESGTATTGFFDQLEERAAGTDWTFDERALSLQATLYAAENLPTEEALEISQANMDGRFATVFHRVLDAFNILEEGSPHQGFFDAVYVDGRSLDDATAEFGIDARLAHDIEQTLIDRNLLNLGTGSVTIEFPNEEAPQEPLLLGSEGEPGATTAFDTAVLRPQIFGPDGLDIGADNLTFTPALGGRAA